MILVMTPEWGLTHPCPVDMKTNGASFNPYSMICLSILEKEKETQGEEETSM